MLHCLNLKHSDHAGSRRKLSTVSELQVSGTVANRICAACSKRRESNKNDNCFDLYDVQAIMAVF